MRGPARSKNYPAPQQQQQPLLANQQNPIPEAAPQAPNVQQLPVAMNTAGYWICPSNPRWMNNDIVPAALP